MAFASNRKTGITGFLVMLTGTLLLTSCSTSEKVVVPAEQTRLPIEPRSSLLSWHDVTHKSYYGLRGAVKRLVVKPALLLSESNQAVSDEWEYLFNDTGRLTSKFGLGDGVDFKTLYTYSEHGNLTHVASYKANKLWRTSDFEYRDGQLVKINFADHSSSEQGTVKVSLQRVADGWFEIQTPVTEPGLPAYTQFLKDGTLVWSNRGDINNGLGELYYLRTVDSVTSSSVAGEGTVNMKGQGGYRYLYRKDGLLQAVESYNAHANRLFHVTRYAYDNSGLLLSEQREVKDSSLFNEATGESVNYEYQKIDSRGNWTKRKLTVKSVFQVKVFSESRQIEYY